MSDSQSSGEQEVKVSLEQEAKIKDILVRGQQIAPFYDEQTLLQIYKNYFSSEPVFYNQLEMIAKSRAQQNDDASNAWTVLKKGKKAQTKKEDQPVNQPVKTRYNFLEDTKLIERAMKFKKEDFFKQKQDYKQTNIRLYKQKVQNQKPYYQPRQKYHEKNEKYTQPDNQKRIRYKEKIIENENKDQFVKSKNVQKIATPQPAPQINQHEKINNTQTNKPIETKPQQNSPKQPKQPKLPKYAEKKQKYVEKKIQKSTGDSKISSSQAPKQIISQGSPEGKSKNSKNKQTNHTNNYKQKDTKNLYKPKEQIPTKDQPKSLVSSEVDTKKEDKIQKKSEKLTPFASQPIKNVSETEIKTTLSKQIQQPLDPEVAKQFATSCKQNSYILPYIKPSAKLQIISYLRYPNGSAKQVTTREPLAQNN